MNFYQVNQIKRVRVVKRADSYYCQFLVDVERTEIHQPSGQELGIDVGLEFFYTDSSGATVENPQHLRKSEKALKRLQRRVSKKKKGSSNRRKAIKKLAKKHLKVSRQRREFAVITARTLVKSADLIAYEDLQIKNIVKNHRLAKSISDAAWGEFIRWVEYFGKLNKIALVAVKPHYSSQECSDCGERVQKTLRTRTHICKCGASLHRDHNAAKVILSRATGTVGQTETLKDTCVGGFPNLSKVSGTLGDRSTPVLLGQLKSISWLDEPRIPFVHGRECQKLFSQRHSAATLLVHIRIESAPSSYLGIEIA